VSLQVVSTVRRDNVQFFIKRRFFCTILAYEDVSRCKFSHRRTCMYATFHIRNHVRDHWFEPREGLWCVFTVKKRPSAQLFDLHARVRMQIFSWEDVSVYNLSHNFLDRHISTQRVDYKTCSCVCSHTKRRVSAHFLSYEVISMRYVKHMTPCWSPNFPETSRNDVQPHDLTYESFSVCNFSHTKSCLRTVVWPTRRTVMRVRCKHTSLYTTFWLPWMCSHENFIIEACVCTQLVTQFPMLCSTDMFPRSVSTTRRVHARVRTL